MALLGVSGYYVSLLLDFEGLRYVSASLERLLLYLYPVRAADRLAMFW